MKMKSTEYLHNSIYYRKSGQSGNTALLFIHGAGGDHKLFHHQIRDLSRDYLVLAPDLPAHGFSKDIRVASMQSYTEAIEAICSAEGITSIVPVGHSMGGAVALELYRKNPGLIAALILISTAPVLPVSPLVFDLIDKDFNTFCDFLIRFSFTPASAEEIKQLSAKTLRETGKEIIEIDFRICAESGQHPVVDGINVPILAIANRNDKMVPSSLTEEFSGIAENSKVVIYEAGGHMPQLENAAEVNRDIRDFLSGLTLE